MTSKDRAYITEREEKGKPGTAMLLFMLLPWQERTPLSKRKRRKNEDKRKRRRGGSFSLLERISAPV